MDLTLTSGGGLYSISPIATIVNPQGFDPFVFGGGSGAFLNLLSSPQNTEIHQPYTKNT
jgi:cellobiose-specific phosphotransferase system component IIC